MLSHMVAGYLLHKCSQKHSCSTCKEAQESIDLDGNNKLLCCFKAYDQDKSQIGGLHAPSASFLKYIVELEYSLIYIFFNCNIL